VWDKKKQNKNKTKKKKQQNHAREGVGSEGTDGLPAAVLRKNCDTFKILHVGYQNQTVPTR